jgi:hypothetical protein
VALGCCAPLLSGVAGYSDHADISVAPVLAAYPIDHVEMVCIFVTVVALGFAGSARLGNHVDISVGDESPGVTRFKWTKPKRDVCGLGRQDVGHVRALHVLVVQGTRIKHRIGSWTVRPVDIQCKMNSVPHADPKVALFNHAGRSVLPPTSTRTISESSIASMLSVG